MVNDSGAQIDISIDIILLLCGKLVAGLVIVAIKKISDFFGYKLGIRLGDF